MQASANRTDDAEFVHDGIEFRLNPMSGHSDGSGPILVQKDRWMIDRYSELADEFSGSNVVELGLYDGGSTIFLDALLAPRRLLAIELAATPLVQLDSYIQRRERRDAVVQALGVDQADVAALRMLIDECFSDQPLDLVIDDASHLYGPTVSSFRLLFPCLRPGGLFIVEDWSHEHEFERGLVQFIADGKIDPDEFRVVAAGHESVVPLGQLALELTALVAAGSDVISDIRLRRGWMEVRRGPADLDPATFDHRELIGPMARTLLTH